MAAHSPVGMNVDTLDIDACAEFLKINRATALELAGAGTLPGAKIGRSWVFLEDELTEYLRAETRKQMRERQAKATTAAELDAAAARNPSMVVTPPRRRGKERRALPDLSGYDLPQLLGERAAA